MSNWETAQSLSGYPDTRVDEVDVLINMLNTRIGMGPQP